MLLPSTITARRTRRYTSTLYIHRTIHGVGYNPINDGRRYTIRSPILSNLPPVRPTLSPPFTPAVHDPELYPGDAAEAYRLRAWINDHKGNRATAKWDPQLAKLVPFACSVWN